VRRSKAPVPAADRRDATEHRADATVVEVSVRDYLTHRRALPHLVELAPHQRPAAFQPGAGEAAIGPTCDALRVNGGPQPDVRLLVDDGQRHRALAVALARFLRCDVYITPEGATVRYVRESSIVTGDLWDAVAIDRASGEPARWLVVHPVDLPTEVPTWFTTVRGRLRQANGLVTVALPGGLAFATKNTFRDAVYLAEQMRENSSRITTVAVGADLGRFEISRFDNAGSLLGGVEFATLVAASLDLIHPDVQLALTWPTDVSACAALDVEIMRFADALNRTVWVPQAQGAAFVLPGCGEFAAVDEIGGPSVWRAYPARLVSDGRPSRGGAEQRDTNGGAERRDNYRTDVDGRLVPHSEPVATAFTGVPFVSVPAQQLENQRHWYESVVPGTGLFPLDLGVLCDGRLGVLMSDGSPSAVSPRGLRALLRQAGWANEDLVLLAHLPAGYWDQTIRHARSLTEALAVDIWLPAPGAEVWARPEGGLGAELPTGAGEAWRVIAYGRPMHLDGQAPDENARPAMLTTGPRPAGQPGRQSVGLSTEDISPASSTEDTFTMVDAGIPEHIEDAGPSTEIEPALGNEGESDAIAGPVEPVGVTLARTQGAAGAAAVPWLPPTPVVNRRAMDLYIWTPLATDQIEAWGLPSADLFLLAGQDPLRLAERRRDGYLLRVFAPSETAVDLFEHAEHAPAAIRQRLFDTGCTHLLPLAWLSDLRVTARFDLDGHGGVAARDDIAAGALAIRFEGADHGVPGLPNEVVRWPDKGQRAAPTYLMLPDQPVAEGQVSHQGYVPLSRRKPPLVDGHRLLEVKVPKRRVIDVPATLDSLGGLPVLGRMHDFVGLDLLLPVDDLPNALVSRVWRSGPTGKPLVERLPGETLSNALAIPMLAAA
jgi:hypothetical protein